MTAASIRKEIERAIELKNEVFGEINRAPQAKLESPWFRDRLAELNRLDRALDAFTAALQAAPR